MLFAGIRASIGAVLIGLASCSVAMAQDVCSVALTQRAFDMRQSALSDDIAYSKRSALCDEEYSSVEEAKGRARSSGFNLDYSPLSIGGSESTRSSSGRVSIKMTKFCTASAEDFQRAYANNYSEQIASIAVNAWLECTKSQNGLWLTYDVAPDGQLFTGTLHHTIAYGPTGATITGLAAVPPSAQVTCNLAGGTYKPGSNISLPITATTTTVACSKPDKTTTVRVALQTDAGALPFVELPAAQTVEQRNLVQLKAQVDALKLELQRAAAKEMVVAFNSATCPVGYNDFAIAQGRVLLGSGNAGGANKDEAGQVLKDRDLGITGGAEMRIMDGAKASGYRVSTRLHTHGAGWDGPVVVASASGSSHFDGEAVSALPPFATVRYCIRN